MGMAVGLQAGELAQYAAWRRAAVRTYDAGESPFARLLKDRWLFLPPATRSRFLCRIAAGACVNYVGEVAECRMSWSGWLLAQAARLIGGPLPISADTGVSASVSVTADAESESQYWTRQYGRRRGFPQVIHSAKRFAGPTGLEEYLGLGLGIALRLDERAGTLLFLSDHYFLKIGFLRLRIPEAILGRLVIAHTDLGAGRFAFTLDLAHPLLGELIHQTAIFADCEPGDR